MKPPKAAVHIGLVILILLIVVGIPIFYYFGIPGLSDSTDAVSGASVVVPDLPSGVFFVYINKEKHSDTLEDWRLFFCGEEFPVIFEDIKCLIAKDDLLGEELAKRFMAQLPENQMTLRSEDGTLLASKIEKDLIDVAVMSSEYAENLKVGLGKKLLKITVTDKEVEK